MVQVYTYLNDLVHDKLRDEARDNETTTAGMIRKILHERYGGAKI